MNGMMKILLTILICSQFILGNNNIYRDNSLLFSIPENIKKLQIDNDFYRTNDSELNIFLNKYNILRIEPWLKSATEKDFDGDIYLNRIYRITFNEKAKSGLLAAMNELKGIPNIQYVERENIHRIY